MAWGRVLAVLAKAGPQAAKQLPKLWPLLLESKNRDRLTEFVRDLANASPAKRLRARVELTAALADKVVVDARDEADRQQAEAWATRARNLSLKLNMPMSGRKSKRDHRLSITRRLDELHQEMNEHLDSSE